MIYIIITIGMSEIMDWIKVEEFLPELYTVILASDGKRTFLCEYVEETDWDKEYREKSISSWDGHWLNCESCSSSNYVQGIIAWMELPKYEPEPESKIYPVSERTAEQIYDFIDCEPDWDEWVRAGIELGYGKSEDDFEHYDYEVARGDWDYTR